MNFDNQLKRPTKIRDVLLLGSALSQTQIVFGLLIFQKKRLPFLADQNLMEDAGWNQVS